MDSRLAHPFTCIVSSATIHFFTLVDIFNARRSIDLTTTDITCPDRTWSDLRRSESTWSDIYLTRYQQTLRHLPWSDQSWTNPSRSGLTWTDPTCTDPKPKLTDLIWSDPIWPDFNRKQSASHDPIWPEPYRHRLKCRTNWLSAQRDGWPTRCHTSRIQTNWLYVQLAVGIWTRYPLSLPRVMANGLFHAIDVIHGLLGEHYVIEGFARNKIWKLSDAAVSCKISY